jgi:hypothetical protein
VTAEIAIMNKYGVALAADSAVTIADTKIYNTNKLFMLSKYQPVGIMVYGNAELMGVPWEIIIKRYRKYLGEKEFKKLSGYGDDFISYLDKNQLLFPADHQEQNVYEASWEWLSRLVDVVNEEVEAVTHKGKTITEFQIEQIINKNVKKNCEILEKLPRIPTFPKEFEKEFFRKYRVKIKKVIGDVFQKLPISPVTYRLLRRICVTLFARQMSAYMASSTGIVVAGYGEDDLYPVIKAYDIETVSNDRLKFTVLHEAGVSLKSSALVLPFAQDEMVRGFMEGVGPEYKGELQTYIQKLFDSYPSEIAKKIPNLTTKDKLALIAELKRVGKVLTDEFEKGLSEWTIQNNVDPILASVSVLPLEELALMAESLVNLTSFKRRVTLVAETVGGPIDVAVISKGDGFVWIKRKHYFEADKNAHFFKNYYK